MALSKCWNIVEFAKISIKMKNCKTFYEALAVKLETTQKPSKPPTNYPNHPQASHTTHQVSTNQQNHLQTSQHRTNHLSKTILQNKWFFWSNHYKTEIMITSDRNGLIAASTVQCETHDKILLVTLWTKIMTS